MHIYGVAAVFLRFENKYLLMKRSESRQYYPNIWDGVGGGIKENELTDPYKALLREIYEETGIVQKNIININLKYLHIALMPDGGITHHYIYFADVNTNDVWQTDEGDLFWIDEKDCLCREFSPTMDSLLRHYFTEGINTNEMYILSTYNDEVTITPLGKDI